MNPRRPITMINKRLMRDYKMVTECELCQSLNKNLTCDEINDLDRCLIDENNHYYMIKDDNNDN